MKRMMLLTVMAVAACMQASAADAVSFIISDGIDEGAAKKQMEKNVSVLLTEFGTAAAADRAVNYSTVGITEEAKQQIDMLWMNVHFACDETEVVERCLTTANGFQVRNIPLAMKPLAGETRRVSFFFRTAEAFACALMLEQALVYVAFGVPTVVPRLRREPESLPQPVAEAIVA